MHIEEAVLKVEEIRALFGHLFSKMEVCGSYRRGKEIINDLDFLVILKAKSNFHYPISAWADQVLRSGPKKMTITKAEAQYDFMVTDKFSWGAALLHLTGSKEFNIMCRRRAKMRTWTLNEYGLWDSTGTRIGLKEQGILETLGLLQNFKNPRSRSLEDINPKQPSIEKLRDQEENRRKIA